MALAMDLKGRIYPGRWLRGMRASLAPPHPVFPGRRPAASGRDGVAHGFDLEVARLALHTRNGRRIYEGSKATTPCGTVAHDRKLLTANDGRGNLHVVHDGWNARPLFAGRFVADLDVGSVPRVGGA